MVYRCFQIQNKLNNTAPSVPVLLTRRTKFDWPLLRSNRPFFGVNSGADSERVVLFRAIRQKPFARTFGLPTLATDLPACRSPVANPIVLIGLRCWARGFHVSRYLSLLVSIGTLAAIRRGNRRARVSRSYFFAGFKCIRSDSG